MEEKEYDLDRLVDGIIGNSDFIKRVSAGQIEALAISWREQREQLAGYEEFFKLVKNFIRQT